MRKRSRRPASKKTAFQIGSYPLTTRCCQLCSFISIAWIVVLVLNSIFTHTVGHQGSSSDLLPWSVPWFKGVRAYGNDNQPRDFNDKAPVSSSAICCSNRDQVVTPIAGAKEEEDDAALRDVIAGTAASDNTDFENRKEPRFHYPLSATASRDSKCSSSSQDFLLNFAFPVCLPRSPSPRKSGSFISRRSCTACKGLKESKDAAPLQGIFPGLGQSTLGDAATNSSSDDAENLTNEVLKLPDKYNFGSNEGSEERKIEHERDNVGGLPTITQTSSSDVNVRNSTLLDELKLEAMNDSQRITSSNLSKVHVRQEPGDGPYNYASDSKGSKILASNKEAKGASNILNKDKDKYLRNPCSVESKYVDIELSEETLVVTVAIANHEFYSSNLRELELLGSLGYPTEEWVSLGKFEAENIRFLQKFTLSEPKWVRYLRMRMLSHYGSDFYCTLSVVEVYGVDAIERLLEDWIAEDAETGTRVPPAVILSQDEGTGAGVKAGAVVQLPNQLLDKDTSLEQETGATSKARGEDLPSGTGVERPELKGMSEGYNFWEASKVEKGQSGRPGLDAVMKLLMQKVRSLEHNQPLFHQYLEEQNVRSKEVLRGFDRELGMITGKVGDATTVIANLTAQLHAMEGKWQQEKDVLETNLSNQLKKLNADFELLRIQLRKMENKEMVALTVALLCIIAVAVVHMVILCLSLFRICKLDPERSLTCSRAFWFVPFLSCGIVVFVLSM